MGLVFLLWAWADSMEYMSGLSFNYAATSIGSCLQFTGQGGGCLDVRWNPLDSSSPRTTPFRDIRPIRNRYSTRDAFPAPGIRTWDVSFPSSRTGWKYFPSSATTYSLILPHWLLILFYLPTWMVVLAWRWKAFAKREAEWDPLATLEAP
jgi:hypothetical protein